MLSCFLDLFRSSKSARPTITIPFPKTADITPAHLPLPGEIVGFFTPDSLYEREAGRMLASASRLGLAARATSVESSGSWVRNASMKPTVLSRERSTNRGPLLYVDVDAVFHRDPWPALAGYDCDVAVYCENGRLIAATILINDTPAALRLMEIWKIQCNESPDIWDQIILQQILDEDQACARPQFRVCLLPRSLCWIFDRGGDGEPGSVYIEQLQASREAMIEKRFGRERSKLRRRRERVAEIERVLANND